MNIILFEQEEIISGEPRLSVTDHRAKHIVKVLRADIGDVLKIGVVDGLAGSAKIIGMTSKYPFEVILEISLDEKYVEDEPKIDIILALPRPIMLKRILSQATTLGIGKLFIINSSRVEKSFWQATILEQVEYRQHLVIGLEQAVATRLPKIVIDDNFKTFSQQVVPSLKDYYGKMILADPSGEQTISSALSNYKNTNDGRVLLAIGPEGGWIDPELNVFRKEGFEICSMGSRILKVDTAVIALHSAINSHLL